MQSESIMFKQIEPSDALFLSDLAKKIYIPHYPYLWIEGGVEWYINEYAYPVKKIEQEILDPNNIHFIVYQESDAVGYLKININAKSNGEIQEEVMELERIYIDIKMIQNNIGTAMMKHVFDVAKQYNKKSIQLKAMDSADKALSFYKKLGFEIIGEYRLPGEIFTLMKPEYRGMYILKCTL